jgi:hypothetical protein
MARIVAIAPDLMLGSRITETLGSAGHDVVRSGSVSEADLDGAELLVADLDQESPQALVGHGIPVLGFYQHTNVELRREAEAAGVDTVVPRSRLVREMPELVDRLLNAGPDGE